MGQFLESISDVKNNYETYDKWEQDQANKRVRKEFLAKTLDIPKDKLELTKNKAQTVIRATEILDKYSEDYCEDTEQVNAMMAAPLFFGLPFLIDHLSQKYGSKDVIKNLKYSLGAQTVLTLGATITFILWSNSKQKEASRIGRFHAMQNDLNDAKNFVIYTPEQIKEAQEKVKSMNEEDEKSKTKQSFINLGIFNNQNDDTNIMQMFKNIKTIKEEKESYKEYENSKDDKQIEILKNRKLTKAQIEAGKQNKELIVDTVKEINIKAEEYSENIENAFDTVGTLSFLAAIPIGMGINKLLKLANVSGKTRMLISGIVPAFTALGIQLEGTSAQKQASRVGRYQARKDLSENSARLLAYSDEDMKKIEHITAPKQKKSLSEKISQSFSFLKQYYKDNKEYKEYKENQMKEAEKLQNALKEVKISDKQLNDAKNLQKKVFMAFGEIDEMSQRYSEDTEAGCEIAKELVNTSWVLASTGAVIASFYAVSKGKFPIAKIGDMIVNATLKKESSLREAYNNFYKSLKENKLTQKFQKSLVDEKVIDFFKSDEGKKIKPAFDKLQTEISNVIINSSKNPNETRKLFSKLVYRNADELGKAMQESENFSKDLKEYLEKNHLKQGTISKWSRNFVTELIDALNRHQLTSAIESNKELEPLLKYLPKRSAEDYKTLIGTGVAAGIPILGTMFAIPYAINSALTDIQKKAGKIGIMKAIEKIDDDRIFADDLIAQNKTTNHLKNKAVINNKSNNPFENF